MTTREKILAQLVNEPISSWQDVKDALHYSEYPNMMKVVRGLEKEGLVYRQVGKNADGTHTLDIRVGKRPLLDADKKRLEGAD